jgi:hypothetical protein
VAKVWLQTDISGAGRIEERALLYLMEPNTADFIFLIHDSLPPLPSLSLNFPPSLSLIIHEPPLLLQVTQSFYKASN